MIKKLIQTLKEKGCEMGYNGSTWYSLAEIERLGKQIESESANEPKCLKCGGMIEYDDCSNLEYKENFIQRKYWGHCVECKTDYIWEEEYKFSKIKNLQFDERN